MPTLTGSASVGYLAEGDLRVATPISGSASVGLRTQAMVLVQAAVTAPPVGVSTSIRRVSPIMPTPTLDSMGRPVNWTESSKVVEEWGRLQVVFNGVDVTFYRDVPTQVTQVEFTEPFSDSVAVIKFPQISPFEDLPAWLADWVNVDINLVKPNGTVENIWEGLYASEEDAVQKNAEFTAECIGALYQADMFKRYPSFNLTIYDIGTIIAGVLNQKVANNGLRLAYTAATKVGILALLRGAWQPLLTGYIQELLAGATLATDVGNGFAVGLAVRPDDGGYWMLTNLGHIIPFDDHTVYYGSMANQQLNKHMTGIAVRPQGDGYWLVTEDGSVYAFGGAPYLGGMGGVILNNWVTEIVPTPTGLGYWIVARDGGVFAKGDAGFYGSGVGIISGNVESMTPTPTGLGYFLLAVNGDVYAFGDAVWNGNATFGDAQSIVATDTDSYLILNGMGEIEAFGSAVHYGDMGGIPLNGAARDIQMTNSGLGYWFIGEDGGVFSFGDAVFHGSVPGGHGVANQYTLHKDRGRVPVIRLKDKLTQHWTVTVGTPGVTHSLSRDFTMTPNAIYAEGTAPDGCHWRNTRYPRLAANLDSAFFLPMATQIEVEPHIYADDGVITGANPLFDRNRVRVEGYTNLGDMVTKYEGLQSVRSDLYRNRLPVHQGTIHLEVDPEEGSRFGIRAGHNIMLKGYRGEDQLFHIAKAALNFKDLTVELTVDQKAQDLMTLSAVNARDRSTVEASKSFKPSRRHSVQVEDRVAVFDCESGAGKVREYVEDGGWYVWRVPFAERGEIVKTYVAVGVPPEASGVDYFQPVGVDFGLGVFANPVELSTLNFHYPDGPFVPPPSVSLDENEEYNPWDSWGKDEPIIAWGSNINRAGYSPGTYNTDGTADITGELIDNGQWFYQAKYPPWLWVAFWFNGSAIPDTVMAWMDFTPGVLAST